MSESLTERADRLGVERIKAKGAYDRATAKTKEAVIALYEAGYGDTEIAALTRVDRMTVLSWTGRRNSKKRAVTTQASTDTEGTEKP